MRREAPEADQLYRAIGRRIRTNRNNMGLTQEALASGIDASRTTITNIEKGTQAATLHQLWSIAEVLNVSVSDLIPDKLEVAAEAAMKGRSVPRTLDILRTLTSVNMESTDG